MQQTQLKTHPYPMDADQALTADQASRLAVTAVTEDLEYWASTASVDGRVDLNDLIQVLDVVRQASTPQPDWSELN